MSDIRTIRKVLISVYHKEGLEPLLAALAAAGVEFLSTGGTKQYIQSRGYACAAVEDVTGYPSVLGGRVKTLHPKIFGGILARRSREDDRQQMADYGMEGIDLVVVDLYPFEATVAQGAAEDDIIEKIDIGGVALIRAAAKNFDDVTIVASNDDYGTLLAILAAQGPQTTRQQRRQLATNAFATTQHYDTAIRAWLAATNG